MNKVRRGQLEKIQTELETLAERLGTLLEEENEYYDNMPENFQNGEKGDKAQAAIEAMDSALNSINEATGSILEVIEA